MKKYNNKRTKIIFFFATVFLILLSILSYVRVKNLIDSSRLVNHTTVVKFNLRNTFSYLLEMEANQRGFIITNDSAAFLTTYYTNINILENCLNKIDSLTTDNISQQRNTNLLRTLVEKRKKYMHEILTDSPNQQITLKRMLRGKALMDEVRNQIYKMESEEDELLSTRTSILNKETSLTPIVTFFLILSSIILLILAYHKIMTDLRLSNVLRVEIQSANNALELKNKELKDSEERFFKIFDNNPVALSFGEIGSNKITYVNKLFYNYFGYTKEEVIGHTSEELNLVSPEENARLLPIILSYLDESRSVAELQALPAEEMAELLTKLRQKMFGNGFEVHYTRKNKETFWAIVFYEIIDIGGKKFALTSYQDISEIKKTEKKIEKQNEDLIKMNKELESFNYVSSHDLQEPLRKIQIFSSQIVEKDHKNLSEKGKELFSRIQNSAFKMQTLIQDLLTYSRTNLADRKFEITDVKKIVEEVKEELKDELKQKNGHIEISDMCEIKVIAFQFRQLIYNLTSNSLKFSKEGIPPEIKIKSEINKGRYFDQEKLDKETRYCHITVADNGIGFEKQYNEKIFEVFQQLHRKNEYKGTGIGLAIVKKIVDNHSGVITVESIPNAGTTFHIYLPEMNDKL